MVNNNTSAAAEMTVKKEPSYLSRLKNNFRKHYVLYLLALPAFIHCIIFNYVPMYGIQIAFKEYNGALGIWKSPWVGLEHFERFIKSVQFLSTLKNTLIINFYSIPVGFITTIAFALMLNSLNGTYYKKTVQMITYIPHFISTVVMAGLLLIFLEYPSGMINNMLGLLGIKPVNFMAKPSMFADIYVWSDVWQGTGWASILYISALAGIDPQLHEAAIIDGASKLKRIWHIDLPGIMPIIVIRLILRCGAIMNVGFEKVYLLQNALNLVSSETIQTYTYKIGIGGGEFSFSTAIGLFNSIVNFLLIIIVNNISRKVGEVGLW